MARNVNITFNADLRDFDKAMAHFKKEMGMAENVGNQTARSVGESFGKMGQLLGGYLSARAVADFGRQVVTVRGQFQVLENSFKTMLGSEKEATKLMEKLMETATKTTFDMQGVASGAKSLLAYGESAETVNETLLRLSDIASGLSIPLNDLVYLYGTTMTQGRVFTQDIRQFMGRGIPIIEELARVMNVSKDEVSALVTAGKVGFPEVQKALQNMTNEGGKFYKMSESSTKSLTGAISNLSDSFSQMLNEIGKGVEGGAMEAINFGAKLIENYEKVGIALAGIITTYGTFKAAMIALNLANQIKQYGSLIEVIKKLTIAQKLLNTAVLTNPYVALGAIIAGLGASMYLLATQESEVEKSMKKVNEERKRTIELSEQETDTIRKNIDIIKQQKASYEEIADTLKKLRNLQGYEKITVSDLKNMSSDQIQKLLGQYNLHVQAESNKDQKAYWKGFLNELDSKNMGYTTKQNYSKELREVFEKWAENRTLLEGQDTRDFYEYIKTMSEQSSKDSLKSISTLADYVYKNSHSVEEQKRDLQNQLSLFKLKLNEEQAKGILRNQNLITRYESQISTMEQELAKIELAVNEQNKEYKKNYTYWEKIYNDAESSRKSIGTKNGVIEDIKEFNRLTSVMREAQKMMDLYKDKTKDATKTQNDFNSKFQQLKDLVYSTTINEKEGTYLGNIDAIKAEYNNQIEQLDLLREEDKGKGYSKEQLRVLNEYYDKIAQNYLKQMQKALEDNETEYRNWLADFNETINSDTKTALEKGLREIELKGNELRKKAQANAVDETEASENVKKVNEWELRQKENVQVAYLIEQEDELLAKTEKRLQVNEANVGEEETALRLLEANRDSLERKIAIMENQNHLSEEEKSKIEDLKLELQGVNKEIEEITSGIRAQVEMFNSLGDSVSRIGNSLSSLGGKFDSWGQIIGSLGSSMNQFADMYDKTKGFKDFSDFSTGDKVSGIAGAVATFTELAVSAGAQVRANKEMQEQWNQSIRDGAHEMNILKLEAMDAEPTNIFGVEDPSKGLKDSVAKFKEARKMLSDYSNELAMGQVQTGTKKNMDWGTLATHIGTATAAGAGAGTAFGPWGTLIGGIVGSITGTITGIINGLKEVPVFESLRSVYGEIYDKDTYELNQRIIADYDKMDDATKKMIDNWDEIKTKMQEADKELEDYIKNLVGELGSEVSDLLIEAFRNDDIFSAIDGITNYLNNKIANIVHQRVFSSIFEEDFNRLSESMKLGAESGDITAQLISGVSSIRSKVNQYMNVMNDLDEEMKKQGFDLFSDIETMKEEALSGSGLRLTAEEIKESNGNFMGLKLTAMEINSNVANMKAIAQTHNDLLRSNQNALMAIVTNTAHLQYIRDDIANMNRKGVLLR
jgi:hypothetical protein